MIRFSLVHSRASRDGLSGARLHPPLVVDGLFFSQVGEGLVKLVVSWIDSVLEKFSFSPDVKVFNMCLECASNL